MILTDREIQIALDRKLIIIDPPPRGDAFSSTSIDLTLDKVISEFKKKPGGLEKIIDPTHQDYVLDEVFNELADSIEIDNVNGYPLIPENLILGWTKEFVDLRIPSRLAARVEGKSSLARLGLSVHLTAPTIHAGFKGRIRLEMINHGPVAIRLKPDMPICQLIFETTLGTPNQGYSGQFIGQTP